MASPAKFPLRVVLLATICLLLYLISSTYRKSFDLNNDVISIGESMRRQNEERANNIHLDDKDSSIINENNSNSINNDFKSNSAEAYKKASNFISDEKLAELRKNWDAQLEIVKPVSTGFPCEMSKNCPATTHLPFRVRSGAASVIGPWICVNGIDVMRSVLNNVDRGFNIAVIDGSTGQAISHKYFDLYAHDDSEITKFLKEEVINRENAIVFATSYDDAAMRLGEEPRNILKKMQFSDVDQLKFRDNFIFVGGVHSRSVFQKIVKHDPEKDKYGDWPESIEVEGCIERL